MVRKMFEKAGMIPGIQTGPKSGIESADPAKSKTAPGTLLGFMTAQSSAVQEANALKERVRTLEKESGLQKLDPAIVTPSKYANRHEASFFTPEFEALKAEIAAAGGNVQPIKVRSVQVLNGSTPVPGPIYELIFGHRRHRACLDLGLSVLAIVEEVSDINLFEQMERENRGRKNLSAWEQGTMYKKALDGGLYSSLRRLAESLNVDVSLVSKATSLASLPDAVVAAFGSPLDIQFRWAAPLAEAMQKDPDGTLERARALVGVREELSAAGILSKMIGISDAIPDGSSSMAMSISKAGKIVAKLSADSKGRTIIRFESNAFPESKRAGLVKLIESFLKS